MATAAQPGSPIGIYLFFIWVTAWKGVALWHAAKSNQRNWFIAMVVLNLWTMGLLEIIYLFYFAKPKLKLKSLMFWKKKE